MGPEGSIASEITRPLLQSFPLARSQRLDLLVHALAQLPDAITLRVPGQGSDVDSALRLAQAYGIEERVEQLARDEGGEGEVLSPFGSGRSLEIGTAGGATFAELVESLPGGIDGTASLHTDDSLLAGQRIAIVTNFPAHYRGRLFTELDGRLRAAGAQFRVFFLARSARSRSWLTDENVVSFQHEYVKSVDLHLGVRGTRLPLGLVRSVRRFQPTLLLVGGFSPFVAAPLSLFAARSGIAFGLWSGETPQMKTARNWLRTAQRRWLARRVTFGISYGFLSAEYLMSLRCELPVVYGRNTSPTVPRNKPRDLRTNHRIECLTVADLGTPRKGVDVLIDALRLVPDLNCCLTVVGGGARLQDLRERAAGDERIRFLGPLDPQQVSAAYRDADIFLFPSRSDVFGLVLVEAMGAGIATIVSSSPGAVADLAASGRNCLVVDGHDPAAWSAALKKLVEDDQMRRDMGFAAASTVRRRWTIEHAVDAMIAGFRLGLLQNQQPKIDA